MVDIQEGALFYKLLDELVLDETVPRSAQIQGLGIQTPQDYATGDRELCNQTYTAVG